ncbi:ChrR family anti-sigma-E factor [Roseivivax isoporae]|uniref:Transcriptional regulator n=1 Tax=Roseivivax isoporae LMG 25204 TaxID=1449351 RepID=X7F4U0_9RHOB|nr:ChrR family anti-sigma-E factor [Roseivivax isoporae]ETX27091.1 transcriptional regulator [Roseivivax isoporae LMG 25204]
MIAHHLTEPLLMAYAAGTLPEAFDLAVACHLSLCDECRATAESYDALGAAVLDTCPESRVSGDCLEATLARIRGEAPDPAPARPIKTDAILPAPLVDYVGGGVEDIPWRGVGMGVRQAILKTAGSCEARLLYIPAGAAMPDHGHRGMEITLVLQGAFSDAHGRFARGDVEIATEDDDHMPVADISGDCICLAATDARLRFKGLLPRLAQPFLKI